jgi:hypothetical protein
VAAEPFNFVYQSIWDVRVSELLYIAVLATCRINHRARHLIMLVSCVDQVIPCLICLTKRFALHFYRNFSAFILEAYHDRYVGRDSPVGVATCYGLDGPGSNPGGGEIFRSRPDRPWGPPSLLSLSRG